MYLYRLTYADTAATECIGVRLDVIAEDADEADQKARQWAREHSRPSWRFWADAAQFRSAQRHMDGVAPL